ncbi:Predicted neuraminidase (sialidase) [Anaerovirgula multivorans]|uniref:Predicted neuraminidase (Sialidase) n=1 Tax=Anaerovirgula multivorans TaxID=312168 RepID=A0A239AXL4_9FIRM|nr:sialidase family protein [Anaerovirgula multivorans]SNS00290.1 Predicted neuraminidase (sialidase) [Anaerovirgula multivorans]
MHEIIEHSHVINGDLPFEMCHASTLLRLEDGSIYLAWFAGTKEGEADVDIWISKKEGDKWKNPFKISDEKEVPHWNPVLLQRGNGDILLFYKVGKLLKEWYTKVKISKDDGESWGKSFEMVPKDRGGRGPVRNKVILLSNGWLAAPGSTENGIWKAFVDISKDDGESWVKSADIMINNINDQQVEKVFSDIPVTEQSFKGRGVIQPSLWESKPGQIHMLLRSTEGCIYRSDSLDYGITWTEAYPTNLPNNNSGIDVVKMQDGTLVLAYNPVGINWGPRTPMVLSVSKDNGLTWHEEIKFESDAGEYSYPAIIAVKDEVFVSYTWNRKNIAFWQIRIK